MSASVVAVDPSNVSTGICVWADIGGGYAPIAHTTCDPWSPGMLASLEEALASSGERMLAYVEVPQNGTHKSREGVAWAAGMAAGALAQGHGLRRGRVRKVVPSRWRRHAYGNVRPDDWKEQALHACRLLGLDVSSHDEAEAVMIGYAACLMERFEIHPDVRRALEGL